MRLLIALIVCMGIVRCQYWGPLTYLGDGLYKGDEVCSSSVNLPGQCPAPPGAYMSSETITNFDWSCVPDFYASWHIFCYYRGCTPEPPANAQFTTGCSWVCGAGSIRNVSNQCPSCDSGECI